MGFRIHLRISVKNPTVLTDHVADALRITGFRIIGRPVGDPNAAIDVTKQPIRKLELLRKGPILIDRIEADPQYLEARRTDSICVVAQRATLNRSARCICLGIKPEQNLLPPQLRKAHGLPAVILNGKRRSFTNDFKHESLLFEAAIIARLRLLVQGVRPIRYCVSSN